MPVLRYCNFDSNQDTGMSKVLNVYCYVGHVSIVIANLHFEYDMLSFSFSMEAQSFKSDCEVIIKQPHKQTSHLLDCDWSGFMGDPQRFSNNNNMPHSSFD